MKTTQKATIGLKGQVKVEVIDHTGKVIESRPWQPNLILEQGLNNLADHFIAQLFEYAAGGTGTSATKETPVAGDNAYNANTGGNIAQTNMVTGRKWTAADIGKLVQHTAGTKGQGVIVTVTDPDNAYMRLVGQDEAFEAYTGGDIVLYSVGATGLDAEVGPRTNDYSGVTGHNITTDVPASGKRTMQRTFIFAALPEAKEDLVGTSYTATTATNIHRNSGRVFVATDKGKYLHYPGANKGAKITAFVDGDNVTIANAANGSTITSGTSGAIQLFSGVDYGEVGFSHTVTAGNNINIRVRFETGGTSDPVEVMGPNPTTPSQQLRVTYKLDVTVAPIIKTNGNANIYDPTDVMSSNKSGQYVIERLALSSVNNDGTSNLTFATLEPADPASAGLSPLSTGLAPVGGGTTVDRSVGAASVQMTAETYVANSFTQLYEGTFGVNDAINTQAGWFVLGIFDAGSSTFPFCFKFDVKQLKTASVALNVRFSKTWNRVLP